MVEERISPESIAELKEAAGIKEYFTKTKYGMKFHIDLIAKDILKDYQFKTIYFKKSEEVWYYETSLGLWLPTARKLIKSKTQELLGEECRVNPTTETIEMIKRLTGIEKKEFESGEHLICLNNGVIDVVKKELLSFDKDFNFKRKLNIFYDANADCPKIKEFLSQTFYEDDIPIIQEWFGFHLYKNYFIKKAVILFGPKNTGKSVFLKLLTTFLGEENKTGISLHDIATGQRFTLSHLKDKMGNIYDDLSSADLKDSGGFKIATGGGYVTAEEKFGDTFEFLNYAKNTFATNKIPALNEEHDEAYYLRWLPIPCDNEIAEDKQDNFLSAKLTTKEEMSGLLNFALGGLKRLLDNGKFSYLKSIQETRNLMERHSTHLVAFVQDCLMPQEDSKITTEEMFKLYQNYAFEKNYKLMSKTDLGRRLENYASFLTQKRDKGRYWDSVALKREADKEFIKNIREITQDTLDTFKESISTIDSI